MTGVSERVDEKRDASGPAGVELLDLVGVSANRALGQRTSGSRLAVAELIEVIAERDDPPSISWPPIMS